MTITSMASNAISLLMCWIFLSAGISKLMLRNRPFYRQVMSGYGVTGSFTTGIAIPTLGGVELVSGILLLAPATRVPGAGVSIVLLLTYLVVVGTQVIQGKRDINCGCAGPSSDMKVGPELLVRNAVYILLLVICGFFAAPGSGEHWWLAMTAALAMALLAGSIEQLIANAQKARKWKAMST